MMNMDSKNLQKTTQGLRSMINKTITFQFGKPMYSIIVGRLLPAIPLLTAIFSRKEPFGKLVPYTILLEFRNGHKL